MEGMDDKNHYSPNSTRILLYFSFLDPEICVSRPISSLGERSHARVSSTDAWLESVVGLLAI
jgi:hypothetical protein